jgi:hypothetical protein
LVHRSKGVSRAGSQNRPMTSSKDRKEDDDNVRAKGQVVWHEQTIWQFLRAGQRRP